MPTDYRIDDTRRLVLARGRGTLSVEEILAYQQEVWGRPELAGYAEITEISDVSNWTEMHRMGEVAGRHAGLIEGRGPTRTAIVARGDLPYGVGRMYEGHLGMKTAEQPPIAVFRSLEEAFRWLGLEPDKSGPESELYADLFPL